MGGKRGIRCPKCNYQFQTSICESCGAENLSESSYCCRCGIEFVLEETSIDWESRRLCSDGTCIGIINEQEVCSICGKPDSGEPD